MSEKAVVVDQMAAIRSLNDVMLRPKVLATKPDVVLPLIDSWGLIGEMQFWRGAEMALPSPESRLFRNVALQVGLAIERVQITEYEMERAVREGTPS